MPDSIFFIVFISESPMVNVADKVGSKALQLTYKDKLRMVALTKQVASGPYREDAMPAVGFLDVVGNDRK